MTNKNHSSKETIYVVKTQCVADGAMAIQINFSLFSVTP